MSLASESIAAKPPLAAGLADGVRVLSLDQEITFTLYAKSINPLDGSVFWIKASLIEDPPPVLTTTRKGSLHYATDQVQREDETFGLNKIIFTSLTLIDEFNEVQPDTMWLGAWDGVRFSFSKRGNLYEQADLYHYVGEAVFPALETQIIDDEDDISDALVVSNSLPIWLTLTAQSALGYALPVYPSYLVGENIVPPYAAIHIEPSQTQAFAADMIFDAQSNTWSLASDRVRVTLYGLRNSEALAYLRFVLDFMRGGDVLGLQNMPTVRDDKRTQDELTVLAMKKTIEFQASYYQQAALEAARQLILSCTPALTIGD